MRSTPESLEENDDTRAQRPSALTPLFESVRGEGHRWASLDVVDLDPPMPIPPYVRE